MSHQEEIEIGGAGIVAGQKKRRDFGRQSAKPEPGALHHQPDLRRPDPRLLEDALHDERG